jgi:hypothetical protein
LSGVIFGGLGLLCLDTHSVFRMNLLFQFVTLLSATLCLGAPPSHHIFSDFPGGNVKIDSVRGNHIYFRPDLRDTGQDWFYWYFAVKPTRTDSLHFHLTRPNCLTNKGPAISRDGGKTWQWKGKGASANEFVLFAKAGEEIRLSMGIPYTQQHLDLFLRDYQATPALKLETLCISPKGRATEKLIIGANESAKQRVLITARHHACEMMASYVLEGVIAALLSDDPKMKQLIETTAFWIVPFVDKDGVEDGDQGKSRLPRDHNRDYDGKSIYTSTQALRNQVPQWKAGSPLVAFDLHCPWITGNLNEHIYLVGNRRENIAKEQEAFIQLLGKNNTGELKFDVSNGFVPFGTAWNTAKNYTQGMSFAAWTAGLADTRMTTTFEIPYAINHQQELNPSNLRDFGKDLAHTLVDYLKN